MEVCLSALRRPPITVSPSVPLALFTWQVRRWMSCISFFSAKKWSFDYDILQWNALLQLLDRFRWGGLWSKPSAGNPAAPTAKLIMVSIGVHKPPSFWVNQTFIVFRLETWDRFSLWKPSNYSIVLWDNDVAFWEQIILYIVLLPELTTLGEAWHHALGRPPSELPSTE